MENALLVGLSRQMVLERQMDVIANNVANVNTNGFKADRSMFEEYLNSGAHEDNFIPSDRRVSYVQDRGTFKDLTAGPAHLTTNPPRVPDVPTESLRWGTARRRAPPPPPPHP